MDVMVVVDTLMVYDDYYFPVTPLMCDLLFTGLYSAFELGLKIKIISLFSLFLLLFMGPIALFGTIHRLYYIISTNFYLYL